MDERSVFTPSASQKISMSTVTARSGVIGSLEPKLGSQNFRMLADVPFFFKLGDASVEATTDDNYSDGNLEYIDRGVHTHIAVILASNTGTCYISELS